MDRSTPDRPAPIARVVQVAWMVYSLLLMTFLSLSAISLLLGSPTVFEVVDAPMAATALIGVLGLAFRIRMGRPDFWWSSYRPFSSGTSSTTS